MFWRLIKTAIFTVVVPGTVAIYMPQTLRSRVAADHASRSVSSRASLVPFLCGAIIYLWCACDFAVVADHARLGVPEARIGIFPMMILPFMLRTIP